MKLEPKPQKPLQMTPLGPAVGFRGASGGLAACSVSPGLGVALAEGRLAGFYWSTARSTPPIALATRERKQ